MKMHSFPQHASFGLGVLCLLLEVKSLKTANRDFFAALHAVNLTWKIYGFERLS